MMTQQEVNTLLKNISHDYRIVKLPKQKTIKVTKAKKDLFKEYFKAYLNDFLNMGSVEEIKVYFRRIVNKKQNDEDKLYLITIYFDNHDYYSFYAIANIRYEKVFWKGIRFDDGTGIFKFNTSNSEAGIRLDAEHEALFKVFVKNKFKVNEKKILEDK